MVESYYPNEDREVEVEYIHVRDPELEVKFFKTDDRINYREATEPDTTCNNCVHFKYGEDGYECALVEGSIRKLDVCNLHVRYSDTHSEGTETGTSSEDQETMTAETSTDDSVVLEGYGEDVVRRAKDRAKVRKFRESEEYSQIPAGLEYASAHDADIAELGAQDTIPIIGLFTEVYFESYSETPEYIPLLPKPGVYKHPRYGAIHITKERNERFVRNINSAIYQESIPIDAEHQIKTSGAYGWIVGARMNEDGSADAQTKWSQRGLTALAEDRFRYISPEWLLFWEDPISGDRYEDVIVGAALTTRPFFKSPALRPLVANEKGVWDVRNAIDGDGTEVLILQNCEEESDVAKERSHDVTDERYENSENQEAPESNDDGVTPEMASEVEAPEAEGTEQHAEEPETVADNKSPESPSAETQISSENLPADVVQLFHEMKSQIASLEQDKQDVEKKAEAYTDELRRYAERVKAMEDERRRQRYTDIVTGRSGSDDGGQWFGEVEKHVTLMESLAETFGEDSEQFQIYVEHNRAFAAQAQESELFKEHGSQYLSGSSAWQQIEQKANELMQHNSELTREQAISMVTEIHPDLERAFREEMS